MVFFKAEKLQRLADILRRVQEAVEAEGGELVRAREELDEVGRRAGLDLEVARVTDAATLEGVLAVGGEGSSGRRWIAAEALFLDGLLAWAEGRDADALDRLEKARRLYRSLGEGLDLPEDATPPAARIRRADELAARISEGSADGPSPEG